MFPTVSLQRGWPEARSSADELPAAVVHEQRPADTLDVNCPLFSR